MQEYCVPLWGEMELRDVQRQLRWNLCMCVCGGGGDVQKMCKGTCTSKFQAPLSNSQVELS